MIAISECTGELAFRHKTFSDSVKLGKLDENEKIYRSISASFREWGDNIERYGKTIRNEFHNAAKFTEYELNSLTEVLFYDPRWCHSETMLARSISNRYPVLKKKKSVCTWLGILPNGDWIL